jgi:hypothetical protein
MSGDTVGRRVRRDEGLDCGGGEEHAFPGFGGEGLKGESEALEIESRANKEAIDVGTGGFVAYEREKARVAVMNRGEEGEDGEGCEGC